MKKLFLLSACAAAILCGARDTNRYDRVETRQGFEFSQRGGLGLSNEVVTAVDLRAVASNLSEGAVFVPFSNAVAKVTPPIELMAESDPYVSSWARKVGGQDAPKPQDFDATKLMNQDLFFDDLRTNRNAAATLSMSNAVVMFSAPADTDLRNATHKADFFRDIETNKDDTVSTRFSAAVNSSVVHPTVTKIYGDGGHTETLDAFGNFSSKYLTKDSVFSFPGLGSTTYVLPCKYPFSAGSLNYFRAFSTGTSLNRYPNATMIHLYVDSAGRNVHPNASTVAGSKLTLQLVETSSSTYSYVYGADISNPDPNASEYRFPVTASYGSLAAVYPVGSTVVVTRVSGSLEESRAYRTGDRFPATMLSEVVQELDDLRTNKNAEATSAASNLVVRFSPPSAPQDFDARKLEHVDGFFDDLRTNRNAAATLSMSNAVVRFSPPASDPAVIDDGTNVISASGKTYVRVFHPPVTNVTFTVMSFSSTGSSAGSMLTKLRKSVGNTLYPGEYVYYSGCYTNSNPSESSFGGIGKYTWAGGLPKSKYSMATSYSSYWNAGNDDSKISNSWSGDVLTISAQCMISSLESYYGTLTGTFRKNTDVVPEWSELVETGRIETESHVLSNFVQRSVKVNGTCLSNDVTVGYISDGTHRINADLTLGDGGRLAKVSEIGRQDAIVTNGVVLKDGYHWNRKVYADLTVVDDPVDKYVYVTNTDYATLPVPLTLSGRCGSPLYYNNEYEYPSDLWCTYTHTLSSSGATSAPYSYGIGDVASGDPDVKLKYMGLNVWNVSVDNWHLMGSSYLSFSTNIAFNLSSTVPGAKVFDFRVRKYHYTDAAKTPPVEVWSEFRFEATVVSTNSNTYCKDSGNPEVEIVTRELAPRSTKTIATEDMVGVAVDGKDGKVWAVKAYDGHIYYVKED